MPPGTIGPDFPSIPVPLPLPLGASFPLPLWPLLFNNVTLRTDGLQVVVDLVGLGLRTMDVRS